MKWILPAMLVPALLAAACVTRQERVRPELASAAEMPRVAPTLALERFLRAANANDLQTMGQLFGTSDGPIRQRDQAADVERRMFAIASLLRHQDFAILAENIVPGRLGRAVELVVRLQQAGRSVAVPFVLVHAGGEQWLVEQVDTQPLTAR